MYLLYRKPNKHKIYCNKYVFTAAYVNACILV